MLPEDTKRRRELARESSGKSELSRQCSLDTHLVAKEPVIRYSDSSLRDAVVRWIIETDQVRLIILNA